MHPVERQIRRAVEEAYAPLPGAMVAGLPKVHLPGCWVRVFLETVDQERAEFVKALRELAEAAEAFAAGQSNAVDPRIGNVQPVTVAECEALNAALRKAWKILEAAHENPAL